MIRSVRILSEIVAAIIGILVILGLALVWKLSTGSIKSTLFTPYIESSIERLVPNSRVSIAGSMLHWDHVSQSVTLHADSIKIEGDNNHTLAEIPSVGVRLNPLGILFGQFLPSELMIDHPQIWLTRQKDGTFTSQTNTTTTPDDFSKILGQAINNLSHAYITKRLTISRIVVTIYDEATQTKWAIHIPEVTLEHDKNGLVGKTQLEVTQKDSTATLTLNYAYNEPNETHTIRTRLDNINPSFFAGGNPSTVGLGILGTVNTPISGSLAITVDNKQIIQQASAQINADAGIITTPVLWTNPRTINKANLALEYDRAAHKFEITDTILDFGGAKLSLSMHGIAPVNNEHDLDFTAIVHMDNWPMEQMDHLWPKPLIPNAREWIVPNLRKGTFDHAEATIKGALSWQKLADITIREGTGKIRASNGEVHYMEGMPPVQGVSTEATFDLDKMHLQILSGSVDRLKITPFPIAITGLSTDMQYIDIPLQLKGPMPDLLRLIDSPPLGYARALGLNPEDITGNVDGTLALNFPLLKLLAMRDVELKAQTNLSDIASTKLVPGFDLSKGNFAMKLGKLGFTMDGNVAVDKVPMNVNWTQNFNPTDKVPSFKSKVTGTISDNQWALLGLDTLAASKGATKLTLNLEQPHNADLRVDGTADMGAANIVLDMLSWKKPAGIPAKLTFHADIPDKGNIKISNINLVGQGVSIKGSGVLDRATSQFVGLDLNPLIIGRSNATLRLTQPDPDVQTLHFDIRGQTLDISAMKGSADDAKETHAKEYLIKLDKLYTSDTGYMGKIYGHAVRSPDGWSDIDLHSTGEGNHVIIIKLATQNKRRFFTLTSDDFGKTLQSMGFTDSVHQGDLTIQGESSFDNPREIVGRIKIGKFTVKDLPVLALLLNATSPFGIIGIVTDSADFDKLTGRFRWRGDQITLEHVNAAGTAIGINIEGTANMNTGAANLQGTLVPFSMVNKIIAYIPIIGDLLTGGENQGVLAVSYKINGNLGNPNISVNPVSLLTPGFIRTLFFGGSDDEEDDVNDSTDKPDSGDKTTPTPSSKDSTGSIKEFTYPNNAPRPAATSNINRSAQ